MNGSMTAYPLISADPEHRLFYHPQGETVQTITARQFMLDATLLAPKLAAHHPIINLCLDRYRFMVVFTATLLAGKTNLLPSTYTPETLRQIFTDTPDALCLHDHQTWSFPYPHLHFDQAMTNQNDASHRHTNRQHRTPETVQIKTDQVAAQVFTSGSTGVPVPHNKTWGKLVRNVQAAMHRLNLPRGTSLVGTVPPQHMFGFESLVLLSIIGGCPLWSGKPFYPADIVAALNAMPEPRMLVTTPFHLQALLDASIDLPKIDRLLLATAPLSIELAAQAERQTGAPLVEIYGSTETGQIATRRPTQSQDWLLLPGIHLTPAFPDQNNERFIADGGHIEQPVLLSDRIQIKSDGHFTLLGRIADQINMAGKRSSLAYLTSQLKAIKGVVDGVFFLPQKRKTGKSKTGNRKDRTEQDNPIIRLCAVVVAPELSAADIMAALRDRLDPVFLPRPLLLVDSLPYNATGKLPQMALQELLDQHLAQREKNTRPSDTVKADTAKTDAVKTQAQWHIPLDHPVFAGHFPDYPLVPGALLLDWVVDKVAAYWQVSPGVLRIEQAKFLQPVPPGACVSLEWQPDADKCRFTLTLVNGQSNSDEGTVAVTGLLSRPQSGQPANQDVSGR